jgi:hypothetical protein
MRERSADCDVYYAVCERLTPYVWNGSLQQFIRSDRKWRYKLVIT